MTTTSTHTPTPWHVDISDPDADICSAFGMVAKTMGHPDNQDDEGRENARFIVHCVNTHAELVESLKGLYEHCSMIHSKWGEDCNQREADAAIARGIAAIATAEKEG